MAAGAAALAAARWWYPRALERATAARLPVGPDGIILGAEPIALDGPTDRGVLLLHGFGDTTQSVQALACALHARGYTVRAPLLAGHGRTLAEFAAGDAEAWMTGARVALRALRDRCSQLFLAGQSLGGALAALLVSESPELHVRALALLVPYLEMPPAVRAIAPLSPLLQAAIPYVTTHDERSIHDAEARARSLSFNATTPHLAGELLALSGRARAVLPSIAVPTLYLQARSDNRIAPAVAERAFAALGAAEKQLVWLDGCGHVIAADSSRDRVAELVTAWFDAR